MSCCIDEYQEIIVNISEETPIIAQVSDTNITAQVECFVGDTIENTIIVNSSHAFPQYMLIDEEIEVNDHGQYVVIGKSSITLDGESILTLGQGSEIIL